jgi:tryptophan synthase beta subunit
MKQKLTHGEHVFLKRQNLDFTLSIDKMAQCLAKQIPKRMGRERAINYYKVKLQKVWESVA